jgi:hypothetical protein
MSLNILQRINEIRKELSYVQKDQKKIDGQYTATRYDQIVAASHALMVKYGVVAVVETLPDWDVVTTEQKTAKGTPYTRFQCRIQTTFYNVDDPKDFVVSSAPAFGLDQGDKGPGKAHTYGAKSNVVKTLYLITGDEEEARVETKVEDEQTGMFAERLSEVLNEINAITDIKALNEYRKKVRKENGVVGNLADNTINNAVSKRAGVIKSGKAIDPDADIPQ